MISTNELKAIINGQVRKIQFFVDEKGKVHTFDAKGDSTGYKFESDQRKEPKNK